MAKQKYTAQQREEFFVLIDKGLSVRAASRQVGASPDTGYRWVKQAGLSVRRATPRTYTTAEKEEFFRRLETTPNVSAVARSLGFNRVTCYKWAHQAGIFTGTNLDAHRTEFLRLRAAGWSREHARAATGLDKRSAADADKGIRTFYGGRVLADGTVIRYTNQQILERVKNARTRYVQGERVNLDAVEKVIHARYMSIIERESLFDLRREGLSIRAIASRMGRAPSTISRELRRNASGAHGYRPHAAHRKAAARRARPRAVKILATPALLTYIRQGLNWQWSPEQISQRLRQDFPHDDAMRLCPETIYQALYVHARASLRRQLCPNLRRGRRRRKPRKAPDQRRPRFTTPMTPVSRRPLVVNDRRQPGHWEGDLIVGHWGRSSIATLVERTTRYVLLAHVGNERFADVLSASLISVLSPLPAQLRRTLTWDQGAEMSSHGVTSAALGMSIYFCEPASPWQRGSNENTNGLLRQYFPKGTPLQKYTQADLDVVADRLNNRPRKCLDWATPTERFSQEMASYGH